MDRKLRKLTICWERWGWETPGIERLPECDMQLSLHVGGCKYCILERVEDEPVLRAQKERNEVVSPVVPWSAASGDGGGCRVPHWGEVVGAGPSEWCLPKTKHLV